MSLKITSRSTPPGSFCVCSLSTTLQVFPSATMLSLGLDIFSPLIKLKHNGKE